MNFNLFGNNGQWMAVDCGITLEQVPGAIRPAVQMPDLGFITARREQLAGLIVTHAHEDHLGALRAARPREANLSDGDVRAAD